MKTVLKFCIEVLRISMKEISQMTLTKLTGLLQQKTVPWVTYGIKNSISVRHKLYMEMIKAKNDQTKKRKHEIYTT